jgi:glycosyltransferase involved in cell wall biosynthesis
MNRPEVTIVVAPRERFSGTRLTLETLYRVTPPPFGLVYVDGGAPGPIRGYLRSQAKEKGFTLVRGRPYLSPNRARNLGFQGVDTKYVVFLDNDVVVAPGWLDALLECAEETGAWIVGPLYCVDRPFHTKVHMAGGLAHFEEKDGVRRFVERHLLMHRPVAEVRGGLAPGPTEQVEFHCLLARTDAMRQLGPLDERFLAAPEVQIDLCLRARALGGGVWLEPAAIVTYDRPPPLRLYDLPYYLLRWSEDWGRRGLEHFSRQWDLAADDPYFERQLQFMAWQRSLAIRPFLRLLRPLPDWRRRRAAEWIARRFAAALQPVMMPRDCDLLP